VLGQVSNFNQGGNKVVLRWCKIQIGQVDVMSSVYVRVLVSAAPLAVRLLCPLLATLL